MTEEPQYAGLGHRSAVVQPEDMIVGLHAVVCQPAANSVRLHSIEQRACQAAENAVAIGLERCGIWLVGETQWRIAEARRKPRDGVEHDRVQVEVPVSVNV